MKHLIIFINHPQSRLDNAVYRLFSTSLSARRNAAILFEPKALEERHLLHEVAELYKKEKATGDVTFHICADFRQPAQAEDVIATLRLIRSTFPSKLASSSEAESAPSEPTRRKDPQLTFFDLLPEEETAPAAQFAYPTFVYAMSHDAEQCTDAERKVLWKNLTTLSQATKDNLALHLLCTCLLYLPSQQLALAEYLFDTASRPEDYQQLYTSFTTDCNLPPVFGSINAEGLSYPEEELRHYLLLCCLHDSLRLGDPGQHPTPMEETLQQAEYLLSQIPLQNERLTLQQEVFLNLNADHQTQWVLPTEYWPHQVSLACQGLNDLPRDDWFIRVRQRVEALYQTRYRDLGVEFFYNVQTKLIGQYNTVLIAILTELLQRVMCSHVYAPCVQQDIVRAMVNTLQQKVLYLQQQEQSDKQSLTTTEQQLTQQNQEWGKIGLWGRLRGKDQVLLDEYSKTLTDYYILRTRVAGYPFAISLLNQLIPQLSALAETGERRQEILINALQTVCHQLQEARPTQVFQLLDASIVQQAATCIEQDTENLQANYSLIYALFYGHGMPLDGDEFLSRIRFELDERLGEYITTHAERWTQPQVLGLPIGRRIEILYEGRGGKEAFIEHIQRHIPILLPVKADSHPQQRWLYSETDNHLEVIHFQHGLSLNDLSGFSGQRTFIEASLF